jgi:hypothetical protein
MKKTAIIATIALFALTAVGFGFAMWSDTVTAKVTVNTGCVEVGIKDLGTDDNGCADDALPDNGADPQVAPGNNSEGKDVASLVSENITAIGNTGYYERIEETLDNGYPYYAPTTKVEIKNLGSIPVKLNGITATPSGALVDNIIINSWTINKGDGTEFATGTTLEGLQANLEKYQLHAEESLFVTIQMYLNQESEQGASGTIEFTIPAAQWNEVI